MAAASATSTRGLSQETCVRSVWGKQRLPVHPSTNGAVTDVLITPSARHWVLPAPASQQRGAGLGSGDLPLHCRSHSSAPAVVLCHHWAPNAAQESTSNPVPLSGTRVPPIAFTPSCVPGPCLGALGHSCPPACTSGEHWHAGCGTVPLCCSSAVQGARGKTRRSRIKAQDLRGAMARGALVTHSPVPSPVP